MCDGVHLRVAEVGGGGSRDQSGAQLQVDLLQIKIQSSGALPPRRADEQDYRPVDEVADTVRSGHVVAGRPLKPKKKTCPIRGGGGGGVHQGPN